VGKTVSILAVMLPLAVMGAGKPTLTLPEQIGKLVFAAGRPAIISVEVCNARKVEGAAWRVPPEPLVRYELPSADRDYGTASEWPRDGKLLKLFRGSVSGRRPTTQWATAVPGAISLHKDLKVALPLPRPGLYVVRLQAAGSEASSALLVLVTRMGLVLKQGTGKTLVQAVDMNSGALLAGVRLNLYGIAEGRGSRVEGGTTDGQGIAVLSRAGPALVTGQHEDSFAFCYAGGVWREAEEAHDPLQVYLYTDRPVYRPGHTAHFRGVVRLRSREGWRLPRQQTAEVTIYFPSAEEPTYQRSLPLDSFGCFHGDLALDEEASSGTYGARVKVEGHKEGCGGLFEVVAYRKPEFTVSLSPLSPHFLFGDPVRVEVSAKYLFGQPVAGGEVTWEARSQGEGGGLLAARKGALDSSGHYQIACQPLQSEGRVLDSVLIKATVGDPITGFTQSSETYVPLYWSGLSIGVATSRERYAPGERVEVTISSSRLSGEPVATTLSLLVERECLVQGYRWLMGLRRQAIATDATGKARLQFVPSGLGAYRVTVTGEDERKRGASASSRILVLPGKPGEEDYYLPEAETGREEGEYYGRHERMSLSLDKTEYAPGETAELLVAGRYARGPALLTFEREDVVRHALVQLASATSLVPIRIEEWMKPGVGIGVSFVRHGDLYVGDATVSVPPSEKLLRLKVTADKSKYIPGERAWLGVEALDLAGRPVRAQASLGLVDEAVYLVREDKTPAPEDVFYSTQPSAVRTEWMRLSREEAGGAEGEEGRPVEVRRYFPDTALWAPALVTGSDGKARVALRVPDSLTTWRATARAVTADTKVGAACGSLLCTKDFLIRLILPRFFTHGDQMTIGMAVHNYTKQAQQATCELKAKGLEIRGYRNRTVTLEPGESEALWWDVEATGHEQAVVQGTARAGEFGDAMEMTLPIRPKGVKCAEYVGAVVDDGSEELAFSLPKHATPGTASVKLRLTPSVASAMLDSVEVLAGFPYGCTEQTASGLAANLVAADAIRRLHLDCPRLRGSLPFQINVGIEKLLRYQKPEGGWGWWPGDKEDPFLTAHALDALWQARRLGYAVPQFAVQRGGKRVADWLNTKTQIEDKAFLAVVAARVGQRNDRVVAGLLGRSRMLTTYFRALLAEPALQMGNTGAVKDLVGSMLAEARREGPMVHWPQYPLAYRWCPNEVQTTAAALDLLLTTRPKDEAVAGAVQWLSARRRGGMWVSTLDTAQAIRSLGRYLEITRELAPDYAYAVVLGARELAGGRMGKRDIGRPARAVSIPADRLNEGANVIRIAKTGQGNLYCDGVLAYAAPAEKVQSAREMRVTRSYNTARLARKPGEYDEMPKMAVEALRGPAKVGQFVQVVLTATLDRDYDHLVLEDPLPSGTEIAEEYGPECYEGVSGYSRMDGFDDRAVFFFDELGRGSYTWMYTLRVTHAGAFGVVPPRLYNMYEPAQAAYGAAATFRAVR
jgi:hypothetical protein